MSHILHVRLKRAEGSLVRLLGQIGRRGYEVLSLSAKPASDKKSFDVLIELEPFMPVPPAPPLPRPAEVVVALVAKLCDVESVELKPAASKIPAAPSGNGSSQEPKKKAGAAKPAGEMDWEE